MIYSFSEDNMIKKNPAIVLGLSEAGLSVGRSLGRNGIKVFGIDCIKDVGYFSRYIKTRVSPNPITDEDKFIEFLIDFSVKFQNKPVLFITSDYFLKIISKNRTKLKNYFFMNLPEKNVIDSITDKYKQYQLVKKANIPFPETYFPKNIEEVKRIKDKIKYPVFLKAREVTCWRKKIGDDIKGFVINNPDEMVNKYNYIFKKGVEGIVQEIIKGKDTNHFKYCAYVSKNGEFLLQFTLRKIRQNPIRFGIGSMVICHNYPELIKIGKKFFERINYRGVGSAEFKFDERDKKLKLIELNPRYWQQCALADRCGMNFPLVNYLDITQQNPKPNFNFKTDIKWINVYLDFGSFIDYRHTGEISFKTWITSLKGKKIYSIFAKDDALPVCYDISKRFFSAFKKIL
jgi:predicted ATP-grasp superfamily ATP-dependent carboligase